jgi:23S rRNA pseudouridine1911/1915/1917 synthase
MADERYIEEDPELDQGSEATEEDGEGAGLYEHFAVVADKGQTPLRLDKFLTVRMEKCSRNRIQAAADCGNILVNGKPAKSSYKVKPLDRIQIVMPYPRREVEIIPEDIPLEIPYEDDDLLIVNKPAGLVVHPGHGNYSGTLVNALTYHLRNLPLFQEGDMRAGLVHRIDKNTSGLLVVAKNEQAHARLAKQFFDHTIQRRYVALVWGNFDQDEGTITGNIGRSPRDRQKMFVFEDGSDGKHAVTHWRVLKRYGYVTLVECRLETGRTHQIRVHMSWQGHPLFNDERYGGDRILKGTTFSKGNSSKTASPYCPAMHCTRGHSGSYTRRPAKRYISRANCPPISVRCSKNGKPTRRHRKRRITDKRHGNSQPHGGPNLRIPKTATPNHKAAGPHPSNTRYKPGKLLRNEIKKLTAPCFYRPR